MVLDSLMFVLKGVILLRSVLGVRGWWAWYVLEVWGGWSGLGRWEASEGMVVGEVVSG